VTISCAVIVLAVKSAAANTIYLYILLIALFYFIVNSTTYAYVDDTTCAISYLGKAKPPLANGDAQKLEVEGTVGIYEVILAIPVAHSMLNADA
jgi:hypothetical protein